MLRVLFTLGLSMLMVPAALAQSSPEGKDPSKRVKVTVEQQFNELDKDGSKDLTLAEFRAAPRFKGKTEKAEAFFKLIDKDHNSRVDLDEFKAALAEAAKKKEAKK